MLLSNIDVIEEYVTVHPIAAISMPSVYVRPTGGVVLP
jgi:hypothetical protein